jgi:hypothetical protein
MAFVYRHIRIDKNEPFYIGIGSKNNYDRAYCVKKRNKIWESIYFKTEIEVEIMLDNLTWEEAKQKEIEFISLYGRINKNNGTLANLTDGGAGMLGFKFTKEARLNMSKAQKSKPPVSEETRKKLSIAGSKRIGPWKGKKFSEEHVLKIKLGTKGVKKKTLICPHCNKIGGAPQMAQWHFENCKNKK